MRQLVCKDMLSRYITFAQVERDFPYYYANNASNNMKKNRFFNFSNLGNQIINEETVHSNGNNPFQQTRISYLHKPFAYAEAQAFLDFVAIMPPGSVIDLRG